MSIKVMSWVWENGPNDPTERLVLLALADFADDYGNCYPSMIGIGQKACVTERGARGIVRRLEADGWVKVTIGGGRGGKSQYQILMGKPGTTNPETETRNIKNPERGDAKPGTWLQETRNQRSAEPSKNHQEPSNSNEAREVADLLEIYASPSAVASFMAYRRKSKGKALTLTAAKRLANNLRAIAERGGDPDDALGMAEERVWLTVEPDWYFKAKGNSNGNRQDFSANPSGVHPDPALRAIFAAAGAFKA